jgi:hypothetical protein
MGKAARNERLKLDATFLNNFSIGIVLAAIFLPLLSLYNNPFPDPSSLFAAMFSRRGIFAFWGLVSAIAVAAIAHQAARKYIEKIED